MSQFLQAYNELLAAPAAHNPVLQLRALMTGTGASDAGDAGFAEAKATVKAMAEALAAALTD